MRVLSVGNLYPPHDHGGGYELVWASAVGFLRAAGHTVRVLTTDHEEPEPQGPEDPDVVRTLRWYWRDHGFPKLGPRAILGIERHNAAALEEQLAGFRPDVVTWWSMGGMSLSLLEQVRVAGIPAVAFVHDDWLDYGRRADRSLRLRGLARRGVDLAGAARYVFVSETTRRRALESGLELPDTGIAHSGIDPSFLAAVPEREWAWRLLYVGRLDERKGIGDAIEAMSRLPHEATLSVVGDGDPETVAQLKAKAGRRASFAGRRRHDTLPVEYADADAVVFPVRWEEPWGLVPLEAMAVGRPVVATGRGGSGEYLRDGENCLLYEAGDAGALAGAVRRLARDPDLRARLREGGFRTARQHTSAVFEEAVLAEVKRARDVAPPEAPS